MRSKEQYLQWTTAEMKCSVAPTGLSTALMMYRIVKNTYIGAVKANIIYLYQTIYELIMQLRLV